MIVLRKQYFEEMEMSVLIFKFVQIFRVSKQLLTVSRSEGCQNTLILRAYQRLCLDNEQTVSLVNRTELGRRMRVHSQKQELTETLKFHTSCICCQN